MTQQKQQNNIQHRGSISICDFLTRAHARAVYVFIYFLYVYVYVVFVVFVVFGMKITPIFKKSFWI